MRDIDLQVSRALLRGSKVVPKNIQSILKSISDAKKLASARTVWNLRRARLAPCRKNALQNDWRAIYIFFGTTLGRYRAILFTDLDRNEPSSTKTAHKLRSSSFPDEKFGVETPECQYKSIEAKRRGEERGIAMIFEFLSGNNEHKLMNFGRVERSSATELPV